MNRSKYSAIIFLTFTLAVSVRAQKSADAKCLNYEPENFSLSGQIFRRSAVNASKKKESFYVLKLGSPICVNADTNNEFNLKQAGIKEIQLVVEPEKIRFLTSALNKKVSARGTLFGEHTQHHFTKVLLSVSEINPE